MKNLFSIEKSVVVFVDIAILSYSYFSVKYYFKIFSIKFYSHKTT
nr:MAG TPA: hypothetical protein [Caudoviricetes sp.]